MITLPTLSQCMLLCWTTVTTVSYCALHKCLTCSMADIFTYNAVCNAYHPLITHFPKQVYFSHTHTHTHSELTCSMADTLMLHEPVSCPVAPPTDPLAALGVTPLGVGGVCVCGGGGVDRGQYVRPSGGSPLVCTHTHTHTHKHTHTHTYTRLE